MNSPPKSSRDDDSDQQKRFTIERKHLGTIKLIKSEDDYGFIEPENFRDDVFFHFSVYSDELLSDDEAQSPDKSTKVPLEVGLWVEFELDEEVFRADKKLRAKSVRPTNRPRGRKLSGRDATFNIITHHPKARRRKPSWRKKD